MAQRRQRGRGKRRASGPIGPSRAGVGSRFTRLGASSSVLRQIADERLAEARHLQTRDYFTGAAYLGGYAVEIQLKALISIKHYGGFLNIFNPPNEIKTHNLDVLLKIAGIAEQMRRIEFSREELFLNWLVARGWDPSYRYQRLSRSHAIETYEAIAHRADGVAAWLDGLLEHGGL